MGYRENIIREKFGRELEFRFNNQYKNGITLEKFCKDINIPMSLLIKLQDLNFINIGSMTSEMYGIVKAISFCYNSETFIKSALSKKNPKTRVKLVEYSEKGEVETWITSRVFNLKKKNLKVISDKIYKEVKEFFPKMVNDKNYSFYEIKKFITKAKDRYKYLARKDRTLVQIVAPKSKYVQLGEQLDLD